MMIVITATLLLAAFPIHAFDSGSSGADGELSPREDVRVILPADGILNYTRVNIPAGVRVTFKKNAANTPVRMLVSGDVDIAGVIDVSGEDGAAVRAAGDGDTSDDGNPGIGGPGGYDGGAGGRTGNVDRTSNSVELRALAGGAGKGPGGGVEGRYVINSGGIYPCIASGGNHASNNLRISAGFSNRCLAGGLNPIIPSYGTSSLLPLTGGSGGGGGYGRRFTTGPGGGGGGGALLIAAGGTVNIHRGGIIRANGGMAGDTGSVDISGHGGGGAVRIVATTIAGSGLIEANPGISSGNGAGGAGRIRLEAENLNYSNRRVRYSSSTTPGQLFISNRPRISIESVAAVSAPLVPSGSSDIVLEQSSDPVQVSIEASNIPLNTAVSLRVVPDYGAVVITASGSALSGNISASSSSVTVTLPAGHSVLSASAEFTVEATDTDMQTLYMPYTGGERVAKVGIDSTTSQLRLLTTSGREILVAATGGN